MPPSYVGWQDRKLVAAELRVIYPTPAAEQSRQQLETFAKGKWGAGISDDRRLVAAGLGTGHPIFCVSADIRRIIYTTNAIESVNMQQRKIIKNRGHCPDDEAAAKLIYWALRNITAR